MSNYLITGGCGFIGTHLADNLIQEGHQVAVLDNLSSGVIDAVHRDCEQIIGDVMDADLMQKSLQGRDGCFHLAASNAGIHNRIQSHQANINGTINVLEAARISQVPVVYASSSEVYGDNAELPLKESARLRPLNTNGADKLCSETLARVTTLAQGIPTTGLRFFNVYGPGNNRKCAGPGVITEFVTRLLGGQTVTIFGDGEQIRDFVYIDDAVMFLRAAMQNIKAVPAIFNVCTGEPISINQIARSAMSILDINLPIAYQASRRGDIRGHVGDPTLAGQLLKKMARYSLAEGLYCFIRQQQEIYLPAGNSMRQAQELSQPCFLR
ncbi:MAG: NAD-dependent epimerase/dehydratase family protein [Pseudomonadota bacterium]